MKKNILSIIVVAMLAVGAAAQSDGTHQITQSVIASGGGQSSDGTFTLDGTAGQSVTDQSSDGTFELLSGFWQAGCGGNPPVTHPGDLDLSFNCSGKAFSNFDQNNLETGPKMAIQSDGKIVIAGGLYNPNTSNVEGFRVVRFTVDGVLDSTFDGDGIVTTLIGNVSSSATAVAIQTDGKIVAAGWTSLFPGFPIFAVVRYDTNGSLDASFGNNGIATFDFGNNFGIANDVAIQSDGKIVVVGETPNPAAPTTTDFVAVRFNSNGSPDPGFDGDGVVITGIGISSDSAFSVLFQTDGKIVVGGKSSLPVGSPAPTSFFSLVRYNVNGSLDTSFDGDGKVITQIGASEGQGKDLALQTDGKILMTGHIFSNSGGDYYFGAVRYNANGSLDTSFDGDGIVTTLIAPYNLAQSIAVQPDGKIIVSGTALNYTAIRYTPSGVLDTSWGNNGIVTVDPAGASGFVTDSAIDSQGRILLGGQASRPGPLNTGFCVVRLLNEGTINTAPNAVNDTYSTVQNTTVNIPAPGVLGNDTDAENNPLTALIVANPLHSAAFTLNPNGSFSYTPASNFTGTDSFTYRANDGQADSSVATVTITVIAAPNPLDTTFNGTGKATTDFGSGTAVGRDVAVQTDGKIVVAGYITGYNGVQTVIAVARYNQDGSLDTTFDGDGKVVTAVTNTTLLGYSVAIQTDGKIVVGAVSLSFQSTFAVFRYNPNGSLDTTFDGDGIAMTPEIGASGNGVKVDLAIQTDGKIVVAGSGSFTVSYDFCVARFNPNGSLDTTFDADGVVNASLSPNWDYGNAVAIQTDGKIVVTGQSRNDTDGWDEISLVRFNPNGSLDTTFDGDGKLTTAIGTVGSRNGSDAANDVAIQTDGKIVIAGFTRLNDDFVLVRYNPDGSLDTTFDGDGKVTTTFGPTTSDQANAVVIQADGKIIAAGYSNDGTGRDFAFVRYNPNGSLDGTFTNGLIAGFAGSGGKLTVDVSGGDDTVFRLALDLRGKILAAGSAGNSFGASRLQNGVPTAATVSLAGRVLSGEGRGLRNAIVSMTDANGITRTTRTGSFGFYRFDGIEAGQFVTVFIRSKQYRYQPQVIAVYENLSDVDFTPLDLTDQQK